MAATNRWSTLGPVVAAGAVAATVTVFTHDRLCAKQRGIIADMQAALHDMRSVTDAQRWTIDAMRRTINAMEQQGMVVAGGGAAGPKPADGAPASAADAPPQP